MLRIRSEQLQCFEVPLKERFESEMVAHLREFSPRHCELIAEEGVRAVISLGMERARAYGFTNRGPVRFYLELMFMFGSDFDTDPQFAWASESLQDPLLPEQMFRADQMHERMSEYVAQVSGPRHEFSLDALKRVHLFFKSGLKLSEANFKWEMFGRMKDMHPQKCAYMGDERLSGLIDSGIASAERRGAKSVRGRATFCAMMFTMGHGFAADPLFPWVSRTLDDASVADPNQRAERLEAKALIYLERLLSYLAQK